VGSFILAENSYRKNVPDLRTIFDSGKQGEKIGNSGGFGRIRVSVCTQVSGDRVLFSPDRGHREDGLT